MNHAMGGDRDWSFLSLPGPLEPIIVLAMQMMSEAHLTQ